MILEKDEIIRMKFSVLRAAILPITITDKKIISSLTNLSKLDKNEDAFELLEKHIKELVRFDKIVIKRYPQVIRNVLRNNEVRIGFDIENTSDLNRIKLINSDLADKIKQCYDIRV